MADTSSTIRNKTKKSSSEQKTASETKDSYLVQSVLRAAAVLRQFETTETLTLSELSDRVDLPKPTVFRLVATLEHAGLLERRHDSLIALGPALLSTARLILGRGLPAATRPDLESLYRAVGHSVNLAVLDEGEVLYVDAIDSRESLRMAAALGNREPLHATAVGKAIAAILTTEQLDRIFAQHPLKPLTPRTITSRAQFDAELDRVREQKYAVDEGECVPGALCVGAAISDVHKVVGGISVTAAAQSLPSEDIPRIGELVVEAADRISASLGIEARPSA